MQKSEIFFREFTLGLGFFSGLWIAVGINPEAVIFESLKNIMQMVNPNSGFEYLFILTPLLFTLCSLIGAYLKGGKIGMVAIGIAFVSGTLFVSLTLISIVLLMMAILIGNLGVESNMDRVRF